MNEQINTGFTLGRATLTMSARTICALSTALLRDPTPGRVAEVASLMRDVARDMQHAHDLLSHAIDLNQSAKLDMQSHRDALSRQLDQIIGS